MSGKSVTQAFLTCRQVIADRAYLHNLPENYSKTSSYVISNEAVFIFSYEESAAKEGGMEFLKTA